MSPAYRGLGLLRRRRLADHAGDECRQPLADELADLEGKHLSRVHLPIDKLDDPLQLGRNPVGDEDHPDAARLQVLLGGLPGCFWVRAVAEERAKLLVRITTGRLAGGFELGADRFRRPVDDRVGGVVEHLPDDLAANPRVRAALDFDERWHRVLIEEEMIERPASRSSLLT